MNQTPPFWLAAIGLLLVLAFTAEFPKAGAALIGVLVLGIIINYQRKSNANPFGGSAPGTEF